MLYLEPPFYFINGISVFRDHENPFYYYYMPASPRLRQVKDAISGKMVPQISLIKYKSAVAGNGGFLNFDVHLGLTDTEIDDIAMEIQQLARLPRKPSVVPVPLMDGTVKMMLFGQESGAAPPPPQGGAAPVTPPAATAPKFVMKMQHSAKPSLYGDNAAAFSVQLDQYGVAIMEKAIKGEMSPILVAYALDYAALRPAFSVRLKINWERVQDHLDESFGNEGLFTSVQIGKTVDELVENQAIVFEVDNFVPDAGDAGKSNAEKVEAARSRVQDMITDAFFEASLSPERDRPDGWDKAKEVITDINRMANQAALTGGIGAIIGTFSYKKNTAKRTDRKRLDVEISERSAILRSMYPQGHLSGLFSTLGAGIDPKRFIMEVNADDPWFERRRVRITNRGDMAGDGLVSVHAMLRYGTNHEDVTIATTNGEASVDWASIMENDAVKPEVEAEYTVHLKADPSGERPNSVTSRKIKVMGEVLEIQPADLYAIVKVPVIASPNYPWDRFPQVQLSLRYKDPDNGIRMEDSFILDKAKPSTEWKFMALDKAKRTFEYRISHRAANNADIDTGWLPTDRELVDIRDPFGTQRLRVDVVPVVPRWDDVEQIFVDLEYDDPANNFRETASLTFSASDKAPKPFIVDLRDKDRRLVSFTVMTLMKGGTVLEVPKSYTEAPRILIRPDMKGRRIVSVRPPKDFKNDKLEKVNVELRYSDDMAGISAGDRMVFEAAGTRKKFEYEYVDPSQDRYQWRASFLFENGMTSSTDWQDADSDDLILETP
jgi:hypothetical protein